MQSTGNQWEHGSRASVLECGSPVPPSGAGPSTVHRKTYLPQPARAFLFPFVREYSSVTKGKAALGSDAPSQGGTGLPQSKTLARSSTLPTQRRARSLTVRSGRSTVRSERSTVRSRRSTVRGGRSTVRGGRSTVRGGRSTVRSGRFTVRN